jgi:hypothetical protein
MALSNIKIPGFCNTDRKSSYFITVGNFLITKVMLEKDYGFLGCDACK